MAKPVINIETCIGCGTCESVCPAVFKVTDDGKAQVLDEADFAVNKAAIDEAVDACPVDAITWQE